jgi:hypothetical protein
MSTNREILDWGCLAQDRKRVMWERNWQVILTEFGIENQLSERTFELNMPFMLSRTKWYVYHPSTDRTNQHGHRLSNVCHEKTSPQILHLNSRYQIGILPFGNGNNPCPEMNSTSRIRCPGCDEISTTQSKGQSPLLRQSRIQHRPLSIGKLLGALESRRDKNRQICSRVNRSHKKFVQFESWCIGGSIDHSRSQLEWNEFNNHLSRSYSIFRVSLSLSHQTEVKCHHEALYFRWRFTILTHINLLRIWKPNNVLLR